MNSGGDPDRDDSGLPPVDIEIPDDARELDRDVQAYWREQRAQRRRQRRLRLSGSLTRDGIVLPLLACCLILALITGTLLTVFTATSGNVPPGTPAPAKSAGPDHGTSPSRSGSPSPSGSSSSGSPASTRPTIGSVQPNIVAATGPLPDAALTVAGRAVPMRELSRVMLLLIPVNCGCGATVSRLAQRAAAISAGVYLVGTRSLIAVRQLTSQLGPNLGATTQIATDAHGVLAQRYRASGLTAILVSQDRSVSYATDLKPADSLTDLVQALVA